MKRIVLAVAALLLVGAGCSNAQPTPVVTPTPAPQPGTPPTAGKPTNLPVPNPGGISPANAEDRIVVFGGEAFDPQSVAVHVGHTITWRNASKQDVWPIADTGTLAPTNPAFDAKAAIHPGQEWSFTFKTAGAFPYHNKLNNGATGLVTVTPAK